jgi:hypothetical protein
MTEARDESVLRQFVKRHHVHYSVEPEWVITGDGRWPVGFSIRLFAGHGRHARVLPGGPRSQALAVSLRSVADSILEECRTLARIEVDPFRPVLYESREVPGTDEVALTIRMMREFDRRVQPVGASEEHCLKEIRKLLKRLSLAER